MGMKSNSGLFLGTAGSKLANLLNQFKQYIKDETTAIVWQHIKSTDSNYPGTEIPKSFTIDTPSGKMWTHGNATEHMYEALSSSNLYPLMKSSNPRLYAQFILYDYYKNLGKAVTNGIKYEVKIQKGSWEFIFSKPRSKDKFPVVKHAKFTGFK